MVSSSQQGENGRPQRNLRSELRLHNNRPSLCFPAWSDGKHTVRLGFGQMVRLEEDSS
jgi:hypothetical protein